MRRYRLKIIRGGRYGQPERRAVPRRPPPGQIRLLHDDDRTSRMTTNVRSDEARPTPTSPATAGTASTVRRVRSAASFAVITFGTVALVGLILMGLMERIFLGSGLALIGISGIIAPPRKDVPVRASRIAALLSGGGVLLVAVEMFIFL